MPDTAAIATPDRAAGRGDLLRTSAGGDRVRHGRAARARHVELHDVVAGAARRLAATASAPVAGKGLGEDAELHQTGPCTSASRTGRPAADRLRDGRHGADRGDAVVDVGAAHRRAVEDGVGKAFELAAIEMSVGAERPAPGGVLLAEDLDLATTCSTRG